MRAILLENIRSMNNVGAIFRTADGAGFDRVILSGYTPTPPRKEISKTALGAEESVAWEYYETSTEAIKAYKDRGFQIFAVEKNDTSTDMLQEKKNTPDALLIVGNELDGVSKETLKLADATLHIPMEGIKESLNVAVAAGIAMYQLR